MLTKTRAIVLHSLKYGESKMIVDLYTLQQGFLSFAVHISKSSKARVKVQFFQPLSLLEVEYDYRQRVGLQHIRDVRVYYPFVSIPFDPVKISISLFIEEFLYHATRSEQTNTPLFGYLENSIKWFDAASEAYSNFHLIFMIKLSRFLGFYPNVESYQPGFVFDLREGVFSGSVPLHHDFLNAHDAGILHTIIRFNYETMHLCKMSHDDRNKCAEVIISYYRLHVPNFPELKSLGVLKELFA